jgi:hypothetical protein
MTKLWIVGWSLICVAWLDLMGKNLLIDIVVQVGARVIYFMFLITVFHVTYACFCTKWLFYKEYHCWVKKKRLPLLHSKFFYWEASVDNLTAEFCYFWICRLCLDMDMEFYAIQTQDTLARGSLHWSICLMIHFSSWYIY